MKKITLCALLLVVSVFLCACAANVTPAPNPTLTPQATQTPADASSATSTLAGAVLASLDGLTPIMEKIAAALPDAYTAAIPAQNADAFVQAIKGQPTLTEKNGAYTFSLSSGGDFVYDKPYAAITYGENVDTYVVSEEGAPEETVDNAFYDPLSYVLAGEGGGQFTFATYYVIGADGKSGEYETVSRLDEQITGYSHYEYVRSGDVLYFADAQLSLAANQTEGPYQWVLCVGALGKDTAEITEFSQQTTALSIPAAYPRVRAIGTADVSALDRAYSADRITHLSVKNGEAVFDNGGASKNVTLP